MKTYATKMKTQTIDMSLTKTSAVEQAKNDLAKRLKIAPSEVREFGTSDREYPDMALGAPEKGEMSAQMISSGWLIRLGAKGKTYEYRADKYHLRLHNFKGANYVIES
jgi:hypothetical protein